MMRWIPGALALLGLLAAPAALSGQGPVEVRFSPRTGVLTPAGYFYEEYGRFAFGDLDWTQSAIQRSWLGGLGVEVALQGWGVWVRADAVRTFGAETTLRHLVLLPPAGFDPPRLVEARYQVPTTLTIVALDAALPTRLVLPGGVQPYVTAGLGAKRYGFDDSVLDGAPGNVVRPRPGVTPLVNLGGGATLRLRGATLDLLVRDAVSAYWNRQQHDVMVLLALGGRVR
jgi:hypothetical protein